MKRLLLLLAFFICAISLSASHLRGGQLYWDALGNNQYKFYFDGIVSCGMGQGDWPVHSAAFPNGSITMSIVSTENYNGSCNSCTSSKIYHYESSIVTIPAPTTGPHFFWTDGSSIGGQYFNNLSSSTSGQHVIRSVMKVGGENKSAARCNLVQVLDQIESNLIMLDPFSTEADSIAVGPYTPIHRTYTTPYVFSNFALAAGYAPQNPFSPNDQWHQEAGWLVSGLNDTTEHTTLLGFRIDQFEGGNWYSRTNVSFTTYRYSYATPTLGTNNIPTFSTTPVQGTWQTRDSILQVTSAHWSDVLTLDISASDYDVNPSTLMAHNVTAELHYGNLDGTGFIKPTITPVGPQAGLTAPQTNNVRFEWEVPATLPEGYYRFYVRFHDDVCPTPGVISVPIEVYVHGVFADEYDICSGDAIQLEAPFVGSNYQWVPSTGLTSDSTKITFASPTTTTTYTAFIDGDSVGVYTVNVGQHVTPILAQPQSNQIEITNAASFDETAFLYNYVPVIFNQSLITVTAPGLYHGAGRNAGCFDLSDSLEINPDSLSTNYLITSPVDSDSRVVFDNQSSYVMNADVGYHDAGLIVREIIIPGAQVTGKMGQLKLITTDFDGTVDTIIGVSLDGHSMLFELEDTANFFLNGKFELQMDSGTAELPLVRDVVMPLGFFHGSVNSVSGNIQGEVLTDDIVPFVFRGVVSIGVEEEFGAQFTLYPQPASDEIRIDGLEATALYQIINLAGSVLTAGTVEVDQSISTSTLPSGMYILTLEQEGRLASYKVVVQH